ncbi:MAG: hypothetical protein M0Z94_05870 [Dehalococcoidales bacterium]|nr:hypothetical protein [Dehalococcoidales bacterium]
MELKLNTEEARLLKQVLTDYLSDLRMEVTETENFDMRQDLKANESMLKSVVDRLDKGLD